jgi:hypothetical protein
MRLRRTATACHTLECYKYDRTTNEMSIWRSAKETKVLTKTIEVWLGTTGTESLGDKGICSRLCSRGGMRIESFGLVEEAGGFSCVPATTTWGSRSVDWLTVGAWYSGGWLFGGRISVGWCATINGAKITVEYVYLGIGQFSIIYIQIAVCGSDSKSILELNCASGQN